MAIKPKRGVVKGTKKNDKIVWKDAAAWRKSLTVNALAGNDVINFKKSTYKNKLNGDDGNDKIYGGTKNDTIKGGAGNDKMYGYNGNDKIYGNSGNNLLNGGNGKDSLYGGTGSDKLYGGKGNDLLQSGSNAATTFFFSKGDGTDTIKKSKASDVIQIDSVVAVKVAKNKSNKLEITYGTDKIIVDNYNFAGGSNIDTIKVKNKKGGYDTISIYEKLHGGGGDYTYNSTEEMEIWSPNWTPEYGAGAKLTTGNHTFVYDYKNTHGENYFGQDIIMSPNTASPTVASKYTDTIKIVDSAIEDGGFDMYLDKGDMYIHNWNDNHYGTWIDYDDILSNKPNVVIQDKKRLYNVKAVYGTTTVDNSKLTGNTVTLADADNKTQIATVIANNKFNYTGTDSVSLNYTYNGGHDHILTDSYEYTNDKYNIASVSTGMYLKVKENGGTSDVINFNYSGATADDIRLVFDVYQVSQSYIGSRDKERTFFAHKDAVTIDKIANSASGETLDNNSITGSVYFVDMPQVEEPVSGIETIQINGTAVNTQAWYEAVATRAGQWLRANNQVTTCGAINSETITDEQKEEIRQCFASVKYSDIVQRTINSEQAAPIALAANKFNRYTFTGDYGEVYINSGNTLANGCADTLILSDVSFKDGTLWVDALTYSGSNNELYIHATPDEAEEHGGIIHYNNFITSSNEQTQPSELIIQDKDNRQISVQSYNKDNVYDYFSVGNNRSEIVFVNADKITAANPHGPGYEETSFAFNAGGTNNYTYVQTMGGIGIEYTNSGTHGVVATRAASNDKYDCGLSSSNNVQIEENGGNDTIVLGSHTDSQDPETWNDIGIVCNVYKYQTGLDTWEWRTDRNHVVYVEKEALTIDSLRAATEATLTETAGVNMLDNSQTGGIEQIKGGYYGYADADAWFGEIASEVGSWLAGNGYTSVEGAVNAHYTSGADISGLVQAFVDAKYSNAVPV